MVSYSSLVYSNKKLCEKFRYSKRNLYLDPPEFKINVKYFILGMNPSFADEEKRNKKALSDSDLLLTLGGSHDGISEKVIKKMNPDLRYPYFDHAWKLIDFDKKVKLFWQHKRQFSKIVKKSDKKWVNEFDILKKRVDGDNKDDYVVFGDLLYMRETNQKTIKVKFDHKLINETVKFLKEQINYYSPKYIIVINATASRFIEKHLFGTKEEEHGITHKKYGNSTFIFGGMVFGRRRLDVYSFKRFKDEIQKIVNKN